jgi:exodeoxyribonuclease VII small subunit
MAEQTLETVFEELDGIVANLEKEDVSLEESFQLYHKGMDLLKVCNEKIDAVEKKMMILDDNGEQHEF